jgi:xanthine/CO dehydrogenase XdhC/CoxF family maturation factor
MDVFDELIRLRTVGQKCALATIVQVKGSIPSFESAKLLVREDGSMVGTIGGGCVEAEVWNAAREVIATEKPRHMSFSLGQDAAYDNGLICGGQLDVFVECVTPQPAVLIFGGGHISKSLSKVLDLAGFRVTVIDNREAFANRERFPEAAEVHADEYEDIGALHFDDRQQAEGDRRRQGTREGGLAARSFRTGARADGPRDRRHIARGNRDFSGCRNDCDAPRSGREMALPLEIHLPR